MLHNEVSEKTNLQFEPSGVLQNPSNSSRPESMANASCEELKEELHRSRSRIKTFVEWPTNSMPVKT